jgi:hypothetical protein
MVRTLLFIFAIGLIVASACIGAAVSMGHFGWRSFEHWGDGSMSFSSDRDAEKWSSARITRDIAWSGGDSLVFDVPGRVHYTQGPTAKITVTGPENVVNRIAVDGDRVHGERWWGWHGGDLDFIVTAPGVKSFTLNGSAKLSIDQYAQDSLDVEINGSGDVDARGAARAVNVEIHGSGDVDMGAVAAEEAKVEIAGSGGAKVAPTKSVDVDIMGSGDVTLLTDPPSVNTDIAGSGRLVKKAAASAPAAP